MEVPHADLPKVSRMVFVEIGLVVMLPTSHTTSTGMLPVFAYTSMTSGDMTATVVRGAFVSV